MTAALYNASTIPGANAGSSGSVYLLFEMVAAGPGAAPPAGPATEDRLMAGSQNAITIREVTIGDWN